MPASTFKTPQIASLLLGVIFSVKASGNITLLQYEGAYQSFTYHGVVPMPVRACELAL